MDDSVMVYLFLPRAWVVWSHRALFIVCNPQDFCTKNLREKKIQSVINLFVFYFYFKNLYSSSHRWMFFSFRKINWHMLETRQQQSSSVRSHHLFLCCNCSYAKSGLWELVLLSPPCSSIPLSTNGVLCTAGPSVKDECDNPLWQQRSDMLPTYLLLMCSI